MMRPAGCIEEKLIGLGIKDGSYDRDIRKMGAAKKWVVGDDHIAGSQVGNPPGDLANTLSHGAEMDGYMGSVGYKTAA
tara:strand:+ start:1278 stop:1511 length:234 start_codon:yes stop_codon:yes gene_type:complete